ncbi:DUF1622 domain-containing protein [Brevundimonas sp.]|uniref:DUF1622 domain-containing protein n=1 Tax=Brevundimonas sp. TaxID=1871086 RepID=UPI001DEB2799|nr:DUF1622 domain-containing protein [Brevundimonas sp.]MBA4001605.1 hypothetical protein [Brevundimonas sp.]
MEPESLKSVVLWLATGVELLAVVIIAAAVVEAVVRVVGAFNDELHPRGRTYPALHKKEEIRLRLGRWLVLGLEFLLAADILKTAVAPTWTEIGQLAAIAALRTVLNHFLRREIEHARGRPESDAR